MLKKINSTAKLAMAPVGSCVISANYKKFFSKETKSACLQSINNRAINNGINVKSNFRNGGKNGTAKLKKDRSSAITASIPLSVSE